MTRLLFILLSLFAAVPCIMADEVADSLQLDQVVVTGTRTRKLMKDTPIQTRVITTEDIQRSDATDIADLLQQELPGVEFAYAMNQQVWNSLVDLCVDICQRYGKTKTIWFNDKATTLAYVPKDNEMIFTVHRWFAAKSCPGDWLYKRMGKLSEEVNKRLWTFYI